MLILKTAIIAFVLSATSAQAATDNGFTDNSIIVMYADDAGLEQIENYVKSEADRGLDVSIQSGHRFNRAHGAGRKGGRARAGEGEGEGKGNFGKQFGGGRLGQGRHLQDDGATVGGYTVLTVPPEAKQDEIARVSALSGVVSVDEDAIMTVDGMRGSSRMGDAGEGVDHAKKIVEAMAKEQAKLPTSRRLAEETPYGIEMVNVTQLWAKTAQQQVKICVVDTGYGLGHEDLPTANVTGFTPSTYSPGVWNVDGHGHGTHCAGTIGAIRNNGVGVVGVNPDPSKFTFHIGKGLTDSGSGSMSGVMDAVSSCVTAGADVISMSLGGGGFSTAFNTILEEAYEDGVMIVAAAGNGGNAALSYPASYATVMSVASVREGGMRSTFSQYNAQVEIAGPGQAVKSTVTTNREPEGYATWSGTSMACPHVAGVAALLMSHFPGCTNNQIRNAMIAAVREPPTENNNQPGWDPYYGWGIVNAGKAYELLEEGCENAGGTAVSIDKVLGGKDQKMYGCTIDRHCSFVGSVNRTCDVYQNECVKKAPKPPEAQCEFSDPKTCGCDEVYQADYRGTISEAGGNGTAAYTCQNWNAQTPHQHTRDPDMYSDKGIGNHNHCRNPDGEPGYVTGGAWCYTTDPNVRWAYCNTVPSCAAPEPTDFPSQSPTTSPTTSLAPTESLTLNPSAAPVTLSPTEFESEEVELLAEGNPTCYVAGAAYFEVKGGEKWAKIIDLKIHAYYGRTMELYYKYGNAAPFEFTPCAWKKVAETSSSFYKQWGYVYPTWADGFNPVVLPPNEKVSFYLVATGASYGFCAKRQESGTSHYSDWIGLDNTTSPVGGITLSNSKFGYKDQHFKASTSSSTYGIYGGLKLETMKEGSTSSPTSSPTETSVRGKIESPVTPSAKDRFIGLQFDIDNLAGSQDILVTKLSVVLAESGTHLLEVWVKDGNYTDTESGCHNWNNWCDQWKKVLGKDVVSVGSGAFTETAELGVIAKAGAKTSFALVAPTARFLSQKTNKTVSNDHIHIHLATPIIDYYGDNVQTIGALSSPNLLFQGRIDYEVVYGECAILSRAPWVVLDPEGSQGDAMVTPEGVSNVNDSGDELEIVYEPVAEGELPVA